MSGSLFLRRCGMWRCGVQCAARASEGRGGGRSAARPCLWRDAGRLRRVGFAVRPAEAHWFCVFHRRSFMGGLRASVFDEAPSVGAADGSVHCIGALAAISPACGGLGMTCFPCRCVFAGVSKGNALPFAGGGSCAAPACRAGCRAGCARDLWRASARLLIPNKRFVCCAGGGLERCGGFAVRPMTCA